MQTAAGPECALRIVRQKAIKESAEKAKAERKADKTKREKLKSLRDWLRDAQAAVNAYVRERDKEKPCISCGRFHQGAYDAGHYRSTGSNPALRFHLDNIHRQCVPCNQHKGGNAIEYRLGLIKRIGIERVEWLEGPHAPAKYNIEQARAIRDEFRAKLKALKKSQEA